MAFNNSPWIVQVGFSLKMFTSIRWGGDQILIFISRLIRFPQQNFFSVYFEYFTWKKIVLINIMTNG